MLPVVFIHYNQKLCQKEITQFLDRSRVPTHLRSDHMISPYSNGNKIVCSEEKLHIEVNPGGPMFLRVAYQNYQHRLETSNNNVDINALLGYHVYYRELTEQQFEEQNMSKYEGMDICGGSRWQIIFEEHTSRNTRTITDLSDCINQEDCCDESTDRCMKDENGKLWAVITYTDITTYIVNCKPYTPYAVYVTTVMEKSLAANATGAQSEIYYTRTLESKPSPVLELKTTSETNESTTSLEVTWQPPLDPNGAIEQYYIVLSHLELGRDVAERDYCNDQEKRISTIKPLQVEDVKKKVTVSDNGTCPVCASCGPDDSPPERSGSGRAPNSAKVQGEQAFYNEIINKLFVIQTTASFDDGVEMMPVNQRRRRDVSSGSEHNLVPVGSTETPEKPPVLVQQSPQQQSPDMEHPPRKIPTETRMMEVAGKQYINYTFKAVPGNTTRVGISDLIHFGHYEVRVFACQKLQTYGSKSELLEYRVCSDETIFNTRTKHRAKADNIPVFNPQVSDEILSTNTNNSELEISWRKPESPNGMILYYQIQYAKNVDGEWNLRCVSLSKVKENNGVMKYNLKVTGEYWIRLRAISLYDVGEWATMQRVRVASDQKGIIITVIVLCFLLLVGAMAGTYGYVSYK